MYKLSLLFSLLVTLTINAKTVNNTDLNSCNPNTFFNNTNFVANVDDIKVMELEEDVEITFDTTEYLPQDFNALAGKNDINWSKVELIELEEDVELGFDAKSHLPNDFNALAGKNDIDWSKVELVELEEVVELDFDTKNYLPQNFNPFQGMDNEKVNVESLY